MSLTALGLGGRDDTFFGIVNKDGSRVCVSPPYGGVPMRTQNKQAIGRARHALQVVDASRLEVLSVMGDGIREIKHASNRV